MIMFEQAKAPQVYLDIVNQIFEIEKKVSLLQENNSIQRNLNKLKDILESDLANNENGGAGFVFHDPIGEDYNETRIDCEASIAGTSTDNLVITEVIKPIIRYKSGGVNKLVQKAIVIVQSKKLN